MPSLKAPESTLCTLKCLPSARRSPITAHCSLLPARMLALSAIEGFQGMVLPTANSNIATQPVLNLVPLQMLPPPMAITYPPYNLYQPQTIASQELPIVPIPKETNKSLLLNLTKKMEELAVNMAKEKEKRPKQTQFRTNIWCTNCKG